MRKQFLVIGATVVLAMVSFTGCGSKSSSGDTISEEATVTDEADTTEEATDEEVATEEITPFDAEAFFLSLNCQGNGFEAYKVGNEFVCGNYTFKTMDTNPNACECILSETDSLTLSAFGTNEDLFTSDVDSFTVCNVSSSVSYERTGDIMEFTNSEGNKVKMFFATNVNATDSIYGRCVNSIIIAIDNGITLKIGVYTHSSEDVEISQDEFEKFLPLTEGWIMNDYRE
ncbi:MAG: hypothetical protein J6B50_08685 [Lachnospiraceae bacterium]|nr:hypothetical protein [Lachnospiraceae bacterium]MBP3505128.1 hypothetical protein [Lachnospiraceae bacterium]